MTLKLLIYLLKKMKVNVMKKLVINIDTGKEDTDKQIADLLKVKTDEWFSEFFGVKIKIE